MDKHIPVKAQHRRPTAAKGSSPGPAPSPSPVPPPNPVPHRSKKLLPGLIVIALLGIAVGTVEYWGTPVADFAGKHGDYFLGFGLFVVLAVVWAGYTQAWAWTGFGAASAASTTGHAGLSGKTLWDWMQLLLVPLILALGGYWFSMQQRAVDLANATNQRMGNVVDSYLGAMSDLEFNEGLSNKKPPIPALAIARARTLAVMQQVDGERKNLLLRFLYGAHLIGYFDELSNTTHPKTYDIHLADFQSVQLSGAYLAGADLQGTNMTGADLQGTELDHAMLRRVVLTDADLTKAHLSGANLTKAIATNAKTAGVIWSATTCPDGTNSDNDGHTCKGHGFN
jgi:hypothetical protein